MAVQLACGSAVVMVADDDGAMRTLLGEAVHHHFQCKVILAPSGDELLKCMSECDPDIVITDMLMPGIHGLPLIEAVRCKRPAADILVMTGFSEDFPFVDVIEAGATDFLCKPFQINELLAKLTRVFMEREERRARILAEHKFQSIFHLSIDGMVIIEPGQHRILDANKAFLELIGRTIEEVRGASFVDMISSASRDRFAMGLSICRGRGTLGDVTLVRPDGREVYADISMTFIESVSERLIFLALKDVTEKREVERQLAHAAVIDGLTGLYNKHVFQRNVEAAVQRARQDQTALTLLMFDLDNFKQCNDTHGHQVGDELLTNLGQLISANIRAAAGDEGFRCGGDEFSVLLHNTGIEGGRAIAERIRLRFEKIQRYGTSLSIGVAEYKMPANPADFVRTADRALYKAKAQGKNTVCAA